MDCFCTIFAFTVVKILYITITDSYNFDISKNPVPDSAALFPLDFCEFGIVAVGRKKQK
jgi:hypothetical protein